MTIKQKKQIKTFQIEMNIFSKDESRLRIVSAPDTKKEKLANKHSNAENRTVCL